jgi:large subunit ribosomal protein L17
MAGNKLNRNSSLRKATVRDIAKATLVRQRICTTQAKAKEARRLVDKLITLGKKGTLADKRRAFAILCDHKLVSTFFSKTASRFKQRNGGYTRIIPLGNRRGDNARLAFLELTEKEEIVVSKPKSSAVKKEADVVPSVPESKKAEAMVKLKEGGSTDKKEQAFQKEISKPKQVPPSREKERKFYRFFNIRKIFNRKSPGQ